MSHAEEKMSPDDGNPNETMTASYTEIAFHSLYNSSGTKDPFGDSNTEFGRKSESDDDIEEEAEDDDDETSDNSRNIEPDSNQSRPADMLSKKTFPYSLEDAGTVSKDGGGMMHFVTENLERKIKLSSPVTKRESNHQQRQPNDSSRNSTQSTPGIIPRNFLLPSQLPQIDSNVLNDIEIEAQYLAASVDNLTENLCNLLHSISSITADNVEIHKNAVNKLTDSMDANIKCMYTIMAKTEEISKSMKPTEQIAQRIREIKRLVDMLDA